MVTSFSGCNSADKKLSTDALNPVVEDSNNDLSHATQPDKQVEGRNPQQPAAGLIGEVVSVTDREVAIKLIEMPEFGGMGAPGRGREMQNGSDVKSDGNTDNRPEMASGNGPKMGGRQQDIASGNGPKMRGSKQDMASGSSPKLEGERPDMKEGEPPKMEINYTGETTSIIIPEGVSITKMTRGENGAQNSELAIGDIESGDILQVWFADEDEGVVERVSISNFGNRE